MTSPNTLPPFAALDPIAGPRTIVAAARRAAEARPHHRAVAFSADGIAETASLTHGEFDRAARALAARLQADGLEGERALLVFEPGIDFAVAFFGCLYAGVVPVPAYPPEPHRLAYTMARLEGIVADADPAVVLASNAIRGVASQVLGQAVQGALARLDWLTPTDTGEHTADDWIMPSLDPSQVAFVQYTSGSTGRPRGVMITHGSLAANLRMITDAYGFDEDAVLVHWVPLYHDMGLVGHLLSAMWVGGTVWHMPPAVFLRTPSRWLELMSRVRATVSGAPNFAFDLAVRKTPPEVIDRLDLSALELLANGAEPVRRATVERFERTFAPAGLRAGVLSPCYGMAEVGLLVASARPDTRDRWLRLDGPALERHRAEPGTGADRVEVVSCGRPCDGSRAVVVDPETRRPVADGVVGEIWLAGEHLAAGYWRRPDETAATFGARIAGEPDAGPFLRSGDLGFVRGGDLFVTGRRKDVIIIRGRNLYPHDIEAVLDGTRATLPGVRPGCAAAVGVEVEGAERLVIFQEVDTRRAPQQSPQHMLDALRAAVTAACGVEVYAVVLLDRGSLPKTSSGKVMRHACRQAFAAGLAGGPMTVLGTSVLAQAQRRAPVEPKPDPRAAHAAAALKAWMVTRLARELGTSPGALAARLKAGGGAVGFADLGVDSLAAAQFVDALEEKLGRALPADLLHTHADLDRLTAWLLAPAA